MGTDLLTTFCFYAAYAATGNVGIATILATALGVAQLAWALASGRAVPPIQWASLVLVIVIGGISLVTGDPRYVLYKASIIYLVIGLAMLRSGWLLRYLPPIAEKYLSRRTIVGFGYMWSALLVGTGMLSLILIQTEPARVVALIMGVWAPTSKLALLGGQYLAGRAIVRRKIIALLRQAEAVRSSAG
ncbi:septation protein IspZ [Sphingomonas sp. TF3]|uniref:septation protein IspZ n=1 Tax=Sphingomonas sp. TF3 TaxID=2495580 RepID=UPI00163CE6D0|nr:septation protein IspZ [Sphingomonas sp. TF3]